MEQWQQTISLLAERLPTLGLTELRDVLDETSKQTSAAVPAKLAARLELVLALAKQNLRVAELYGYVELAMRAKEVEDLAAEAKVLIRPYLSPQDQTVLVSMT